MKYKTGDVVLIAVKIVDTTSNSPTMIANSPRGWRMTIEESDIHSLAPAPETDWSDPSLMGRRCRMRDGEYSDWFTGRFVSRVQDSRERPFFAILDGVRIPSTWAECELIGEGE